MSSFARGFHSRSPLVLLVAAALLVPALLGLQYIFTSGVWSNVPLKYFLRNRGDSFAYVSWTLGRIKVHPPKGPSVYITGGSAAREAIVSDGSLATEIKRFGGPRVAVWDFGSNNQNFGESLAMIDNVPARGAWVLIGVNRDRFTLLPSVNEAQVVGRDFLLRSPYLQRYIAGQYGHYKYSFTILPGIFSYMASYVKSGGLRLLVGEPPVSDFAQHRYTLATIHTAAEKKAMVTTWLADLQPMFRDNLQFNGAMLEQILRRCRQRGLHPVLVELPTNTEVIGTRLEPQASQYHRLVDDLAAKYGVPYLDFNADLAIPSADFDDLAHLVEPGRVIWQRRLAKELATLLGPDGKGGS